MNLTQYSPAFKEEVVRKVLMRGGCTIADMAAELNVPYIVCETGYGTPRCPLFIDPTRVRNALRNGV